MKIFLTTSKENMWKLLYEEREEICFWILSKIKDKFEIEDLKIIGEECYIWIKNPVTVNDIKRELNIKQLSL